MSRNSAKNTKGSFKKYILELWELIDWLADIEIDEQYDGQKEIPDTGVESNTNTHTEVSCSTTQEEKEKTKAIQTGLDNCIRRIRSKLQRKSSHLTIYNYTV